MLVGQTHQPTGTGPSTLKSLAVLCHFFVPFKGSPAGRGRRREAKISGKIYGRSYLMWPSDKSVSSLGINFCLVME